MCKTVSAQNESNGGRALPRDMQEGVAQTLNAHYMYQHLPCIDIVMYTFLQHILLGA